MPKIHAQQFADEKSCQEVEGSFKGWLNLTLHGIATQDDYFCVMVAGETLSVTTA